LLRTGENLKPGPLALFVLIRKATPDKVLEQLKQFKGRVVQTSLTVEKESELRAALKKT